MEVLKALVIVFKLFVVTRTAVGPTVIREGFFNKAAECEVQITVRQ
jgi:benzoate 4-monooxygenase